MPAAESRPSTPPPLPHLHLPSANGLISLLQAQRERSPEGSKPRPTRTTPREAAGSTDGGSHVIPAREQELELIDASVTREAVQPLFLSS